ncbi:FAD-dependent oxidoreductase [Actinomycetospora flava]|uniref:Flavin-dependent monooxygenase n=1 Tax=Actinomycetospora flava TaxID=3129232 RepID=A0ABU8LYM8_9PSEU
MTTHPQPWIVVVGAGLGGLTLAAVLHRHGVPVVVLDRDDGPHARVQGGMLDLHEESGQAALRAAGLEEAFRAQVLPGGEAMRVLDPAGCVLHAEEDDGDGDRPEIQRETLRDLLLAALPRGTVRWAAAVRTVRALGDGRHEVVLGAGETLVADLLVGADGAWSRVRALLSDAEPAYSGVAFAATRLREVDVRHPVPAAVVGAGLMFALGDHRGFIAHREPGATLEVYAALRVDDPAEMARLAAGGGLLARFDGWAPALRSLITEADEPFVPRAIHALPVGHAWEHRPGVTLLGDAAHVMSPFAGEGANLAMQDAADLAAALLAHGVGTAAGRERAIADHEAAMVPRAAAAAAESAANLDLAFGPDGGHALRDVMASHHG